ncbi:MAG: SDR family NAD(P)-dependent oxidoreductase [Anaerolineae bacterium]
MAYLVTGGAGFIGSHITERLLQRGETVIVFDNFNDYYDPRIKRDNMRRIQNERLIVVEGDVRDATLVNQVVEENHITHIAHMAARANVRASVAQVPLYMAVNLIGSMNIFEAAHQYGVEQVVLASTSSVYGQTEVLPFVESDSADRPLAAYPASKRAAEILAHTYYHLHQMNITILRFFNVYGPAGRPDMMPMRLMEATHTGETVTLFNGGDISRDWTYIDDTVDGVITALDTPLGYQVINLGTGNPIKLTAFVEIIEHLAGKTINKVMVETPLSDPPITFCNNQKARDLLGFDPQFNVRDGLQATWEWYQTFYKLV